MNNYASMTMLELKNENVRLAGVLDETTAAKNEVRRIFEKRLAEVKIRAKLDTLSAVEKDALLTLLQEGQ